MNWQEKDLKTNVLNVEMSGMNEYTESGGCVLYPARRITAAIGADPDL